MKTVELVITLLMFYFTCQALLGANVLTAQSADLLVLCAILAVLVQGQENEEY